MKKIILLQLLLLSFLSNDIIAQSAASYHQEAEIIRKEIWSWKRPEFNVRTIPAEFANASKVIIARHLEVNADTKKKLAFRFGLASYRELMLTEVVREVVKVNDNTALSEYSEISYTQLEKNNGFLMDRTTVVYLGIKIIKPDGTVKEINADDEVLTRNQRSLKEAKVAVPNLQIGDIVDFFIARQTNMSQVEKIPPYFFSFFDDVPVMHASMHLEVGKKYALEYRSYNGAPEIKVTKGEDNDNIIDVEKKNIPAVTESNLWTAPYRQLPIVRLNILLGDKGLYAKRVNARRPGEVYRNQETEEYLEDRLREIANKRTMARLTFSLGKTSGEYMKKVKKNRNKLSADSLAREVYYVFRFHNFLEQYEDKEIERLIQMPKTTFDENIVTYYLGEFMKAYDVDNSMVYATLNKGPRLKEILSSEDLNNIIRVRGVKDEFYGFSTIFTCPGYLPHYLENTKNALLVDTRGLRETNINNFERSSTNLPVSAPTENGRVEKMEISIAPDATALQVKRRSTLKGHYKAEEQQRLILFEDYYNAERVYFNEEKTLVEKLAEGKKTRKFAEELEAAFADARKKNRDSYMEEVKSFFDLEVKDLGNYKVENLGVRHTSPDFVYSSEFKVSGLVKKAGTSYIIDIGKLQGQQLKLEGTQRKRSLDIYSPFSRTLQYEIKFAIPEGYYADGVNALNKKVENATGAFICEATATGKEVVVKLKKTYSNIYEPVNNWEKMMQFIDAASEWSNSKIILKKKA